MDASNFINRQDIDTKGQISVKELRSAAYFQFVLLFLDDTFWIWPVDVYISLNIKCHLLRSYTATCYWINQDGPVFRISVGQRQSTGGVRDLLFTLWSPQCCVLALWPSLSRWTRSVRIVNNVRIWGTKRIRDTNWLRPLIFFCCLRLFWLFESIVFVLVFLICWNEWFKHFNLALTRCI